MFIIEVFPIARGIAKEKLSYFSARAIAPGSLVRVPLRSRAVHALVVSSRNVKDARSEIRGEDYALRKVAEFKSEPFLSETFMNAVRRTADYYAGSTGSVVNTVVPKIAFEEGVAGGARPSAAPRRAFERLLVQTDTNDRMAIYRSLIREEFARDHSIFFCVPAAQDVERIGALLSKGIEQYAFFMHSLLPKKELKNKWLKATGESHPILIVATAHYLPGAPANTNVIVIEEESSRFYKMPVRPFPDFRLFAEWFAEALGARIIFGDTLLRAETLFRFREGELAELAAPKFRSLSPSRAERIDMRSLPRAPRRAFPIISPALAGMLNVSAAAREHCFIFAARRGLAAETVCGDCGEIVACNRCNAPVTLHAGKDKETNFFLCHHCGARRSAEERCAHCHSWKLTPLGIGIELVEKELRAVCPEITLFRVDKDNCPTPARARKTVKQFFATPGSVLLGTETAIPYLTAVENIAVASLDALFALPDFRIRERIFHLLIKLRELALSRLLVQTRLTEEDMLDAALKGNFTNFFRGEIAERERFRYPPYAALIKISLAGRQPIVEREMDKLKTNFEPYELECYPAFVETARGKFTMHGLLRLPRGAWPSQTLRDKLAALPPQFRVEVDPESLL